MNNDWDVCCFFDKPLNNPLYKRHIYSFSRIDCDKTD